MASRLKSPAGEKAKWPTKEDWSMRKSNAPRAIPSNPNASSKLRAQPALTECKPAPISLSNEWRLQNLRVGIPRSSELNPECLAASSASLGKPAVTRARRLVRTRHEQVL